MAQNSGKHPSTERALVTTGRHEEPMFSCKCNQRASDCERFGNSSSSGTFYSYFDYNYLIILIMPDPGLDKGHEKMSQIETNVLLLLSEELYKHGTFWHIK